MKEFFGEILSDRNIDSSFNNFKNLLKEKLEYNDSTIEDIVFNISRSSEKIKEEAGNKINNLKQVNLSEALISSAKKFFNKLSIVERFKDLKDDDLHITLEQIDSIKELNSNSRAILLNCLNNILKKQLKNNFSHLNKFIDEDFRIIVDYERFGEKAITIDKKTKELDEQFNKKHITNPELFEIFKTSVLNEFLSSKNYLTSRSSLADDYMSGTDNVILNIKTNEILFAFDELVQYGDDRLNEKDEKMKKKNQFGGASPMFIPKITTKGNSKYVDIEFNSERKKYPIFCLYVDQKELLDGIKILIKRYLLEQSGKNYSEQLNSLKSIVLKFKKEIQDQKSYINEKNMGAIDEFIELLN